MGAIPVVKIKSGESFIVINEEDFDPAIHEFHEVAPSLEIPGAIELMTGEPGEAIQNPPIELPPVKRGGWPKGKPRVPKS